MRAVDIMTMDVITVSPTMSVQAVAKLLADKGISAVPVVDAKNHVIGMVSEGDLLHRAGNVLSSGADPSRGWQRIMMRSRNRAEE